MALLAALHFIQPDLDPSWTVISEYELGDYGWIMTVAFLAWGLSAVSLFLAIRSQVGDLAGRAGLIFLLIGAAGPILAGLFTTDPVSTPPDALTARGMIHSTGAALVDGILIAATLLTLSLVRKNPHGGPSGGLWLGQPSWHGWGRCCLRPPWRSCSRSTADSSARRSWSGGSPALWWLRTPPG